MKRFIIIVLIMFISIEFVMADACLLRFKVTKVSDGDTVHGIVNGREISIRLSGIDCYETSKRDRAYKQAYLNKISIEDVVLKGQQSKRILTNILNNNPNITLRITDMDKKYNRAVGVLYTSDMNINQYMLQHGGCLVYNYKD